MFWMRLEFSKRTALRSQKSENKAEIETHLNKGT
jgi:hypothetical protein